MCMLTYFPPGAMPDVKALRNGTVYNDMGHGFAIVTTEGKIIRRHGMDAEKVIANFVKLRERFPERSAIFHSRLATAGEVSRFGCHPFQVGGDKQSVVGHNGIFPTAVQPGKGDRRSDTRIFAEDYLFGVNLEDEDERKRLEDWMGPGNKVAILTVNPHYEFEAVILNEKAGTWHEGIWYSNGDFKDPGYRQRARWASWGDYYDVCWTCGESSSIDQGKGVCNYCMVCCECGREVDYDDEAPEKATCLTCSVPPISDEEAYEEWWRKWEEREDEKDAKRKAEYANAEYKKILDSWAKEAVTKQVRTLTTNSTTTHMVNDGWD